MTQHDILGTTQKVIRVALAGFSHVAIRTGTVALHARIGITGPLARNDINFVMVVSKGTINHILISNRVDVSWIVTIHVRQSVFEQVNNLILQLHRDSHHA